MGESYETRECSFEKMQVFYVKAGDTNVCRCTQSVECTSQEPYGTHRYSLCALNAEFLTLIQTVSIVTTVF
jgi:hypothetical protein